MMFSSLTHVVINALINTFPKLNNHFFTFEAQTAWICFRVNLNTWGWIILQLQMQKIYR